MRIYATTWVPDPLPVGCDILVRLRQPTDRATREPIVEGTASLSLIDSGGSQVGASVAMEYSAAEPRQFRGTLPSDLDLTPGETYYVEISLVSSAGVVGYWRVRRVAAYVGHNRL